MPLPLGSPPWSPGPGQVPLLGSFILYSKTLLLGSGLCVWNWTVQITWKNSLRGHVLRIASFYKWRNWSSESKYFAWEKGELARDWSGFPWLQNTSSSIFEGKMVCMILKYVKYLLPPNIKKNVVRLQWETQPINSHWCLGMALGVDFSCPSSFSWSPSFSIMSVWFFKNVKL